jgi:hypothetical protein
LHFHVYTILSFYFPSSFYIFLYLHVSSSVSPVNY